MMTKLARVLLYSSSDSMVNTIRRFSCQDYFNRNKGLITREKKELIDEYPDILQKHEDACNKYVRNNPDLILTHPIQIRMIYDKDFCEQIKDGKVPETFYQVLTGEMIKATVVAAGQYQQAASKIIPQKTIEQAKEGDKEAAKTIIVDRTVKKAEVRDLQYDIFKDSPVHKLSLERLEASEKQKWEPKGGDMLGASTKELLEKHKADPVNFVDGAARRREFAEVIKITEDTADLSQGYRA